MGEGPNGNGIFKENETDEQKQRRLDRARKALATYYIVMPFILVYLLFKIFPPIPWYPKGERWVQMVFFISKLNIWTTLDERLILLVIVSGLLGSYIHSATSYADFRGNQQFGASWLLWYLLRPFIGAALALVVYFAIRGGLLSVVLAGTESQEAEKISPFGIAAIAGLTGMFSKQASDKLAEVFSTLFKSQGDVQRKDSLTPGPTPEIKIMDPKQGPETGGTKVTITGTGFAADSKVSFGNNAATNVTFVSETSLTADTPVGTGVVDVIITNADGQKATATQAFAYVADAGGEGGDGGGNGNPGNEADETLHGHDADTKADRELTITEGGVR